MDSYTAVRVYLDLDEDRANDERALHAVRLGQPWNGFAVPIVTATELRRFLAAWEWPGTVTEASGTLVYDDGESDPDEWIKVDTDTEGNALYAIDGWLWTE